MIRYIQWTFTLLVALSATVSSAGVFTFTAGVDDNFAAGNVEEPSPSSNFLSEVATTLADFDEDTNNANVLHTFDNLPSDIIAASLRFRAKGGANVSANGVGGDGIGLGFTLSDLDNFLSDRVWARTFGNFPSSAGLFDPMDTGILTPGVAWTTNSVAVGVIDLADLPTAAGGSIDLLPQLNRNGFLDVLAGDDSVIDFFELTVTTVPEPTALGLLLSMVSWFVGSRRR